jgi:hypothetical protein
MHPVANRQPLLLRERSGSTSWPPFKTTINYDECSGRHNNKNDEDNDDDEGEDEDIERGEGEWRVAERNATIKQRTMTISRTTTRTTTKISIN